MCRFAICIILQFLPCQYNASELHLTSGCFVRSEAQALQDKAERKLGQAQLVVRDICARARNAYSKRSLKKDFKDGLTEMEETAAFVELDAIGNELCCVHYPDRRTNVVGGHCESIKASIGFAFIVVVAAVMQSL